MYDQALERRDVAVRSLHRMWHGRLREELLMLGLTEDQAVLAFSDQPYPRTERQVFETLRRCPAVAASAEQLLSYYILETSESRQEHYQRSRIDETVSLERG